MGAGNKRYRLCEKFGGGCFTDLVSATVYERNNNLKCGIFLQNAIQVAKRYLRRSERCTWKCPADCM